MDGTTDKPMVEQAGYEAPALIELGSLVEVTNGAGEADTADMKRYYN